MTSTSAQIAYINRLAAEAGYASTTDAVDDYGFGLKRPGSLTKSQASELIEALKTKINPVAAAKQAEAFKIGDEKKAKFDRYLDAVKAARAAGLPIPEQADVA